MDFDEQYLEAEETDVKKEEYNTSVNPWLVENFDEFLFYCCPECNYKSRLHSEFNSHALMAHPLARDALVSTHSGLLSNSSEANIF